jgi:hypothetical protein
MRHGRAVRHILPDGARRGLMRLLRIPPALPNRLSARVDRVGPADLTAQILTDLLLLHGRYGRSYDVAVRLTPFVGDNRLLVCTMRHDVEVSTVDSDLHFRLDLSTTKPCPAHVDEDVSRLIFYKSLDEYDLRATYQADIEFALYQVNNVVVNGVPVPTLDRRLTHVGDSGVNRISWHARLSDPASVFGREGGGATSTVRFDVSFPLEVESHIQVLLPWPSERVSISLVYEDMADLIDPSALPSFSLAGVPKTIDEIGHSVTYSWTEWALPQNGVTFVWWRK